MHMEKNSATIKLTFKIYLCHTHGDLHIFYIYQLNQIIIQNISFCIFAYLFIILLQNVNKQINNIHLPEAE